MRLSVITCILLACTLAGRAAAGDGEVIQLREALVIDRIGAGGRNPFPTDAVQSLIVRGQWKAPVAGQTLTLPDQSTRQWTALSAKENGSFDDAKLRGGYAFFSVEMEKPAVMLLDAAGHGCVYINGELRAGDPYSYGFVQHPVSLQAGRNELLFHAARGSLRASLRPIKAPAFFNTADMTLPDMVIGEDVDPWAAVVVVNATDQTRDDMHLRIVREGVRDSWLVRVPELLPRSSRKVGFAIRGSSPLKEQDVQVKLDLIDGAADVSTVLDRCEFKIRAVQPWTMHRRTFVSQIDGSVQYYAVMPRSKDAGPAIQPALILSLHGASVEAASQAASYSQKDWAVTIAPTNRRPFGFDWEDWGRLDALEVLDLAQIEYGADAARTYLTGHSMGGHGTWHLGATFPGRFPAIAPSAGWPSFWTYTGAARYENPSPIESMLQRASSPSDTMLLTGNLLLPGIFILHGDADDNVPVAQARMMREKLEAAHKDLRWHEQPGAGHWWDGDAPGVDCVDWPDLMEFLKSHSLAESKARTHIDFTTLNPGISASCGWATIHQQQQPLVSSRIKLERDPDWISISGSTANVRVLSLQLPPSEEKRTITIKLDAQNQPESAAVKVDLKPVPMEVQMQFAENRWSLIDPPSLDEKGPHRSGPFKDAFRNRMILVYGTGGTPQENAWALNKARFDTETFWVRGNGSIDAISDEDYLRSAASHRHRNVILYGNASINAAWARLLEDSPVLLERGKIWLRQGRVFNWESAAMLMIRPGKDSDTTCVGAVGGTGLEEMRATDRLPYFVSGVAYPDLTLFNPASLEMGAAAVQFAGFFGPDWSVESGDLASELAPQP